MPNFNNTNSTTTTANAFVAVNPSNSGLNVPLIPAKRVLRSINVTKAIAGMYMSGLLTSSLGGRNSGPLLCTGTETVAGVEAEEEVERVLDHGR